jgi:glycosyltransferase involved in cell wall biosynthesis
MKILISAYACEPGRGAEPGVGWNLVRELSRHHELAVLTRANNRASIEAVDEPWVANVNWVFVDPPKWLTFWKSGRHGLRFFYVLWQLSALAAARRLHQSEHFDVVHHLTFGTYLVPSPLIRLGIPFVIGPVGGGEVTPPMLGGTYTTAARLSEFGRSFMRELIRLVPPMTRPLAKAAAVIAATPQTAIALETMGLDPVHVLPQSGIGNDEVGRFVAPGPVPRPPDGTLRVVVASRLIGWKAVNLAIEAIAEVVRRGVKVHLDILQRGPELQRLEALTSRLGITRHVTFRGRLGSLEEVFTCLTASDVLLHPALHEAFGQICLESLALGVPVVALDWCGPGMIVNPECGRTVTPGDLEETIQRLADALCELAVLGPAERRALSEAGRERAHSEFHWAKLADEIHQIYQDVAYSLSRRSSPAAP